MYQNFRQIKARELAYKRAWLKQRDDITDDSGIYILARVDENKFIYAYVGQAKHILTRLAQHCMGYSQHIDKSIKSHGLYNKENNPFGWYVNEIIPCPEDMLDKIEMQYIKEYADRGYQLRNKTGGSQGVGKFSIDSSPTPKGYYDGKRKGYEECRKYVREMFDRYLVYFAKQGKIAERKSEEFKEFLDDRDK